MTRFPSLMLGSLMIVACSSEPVKSPVKEVTVQGSAAAAKTYALEAPEVSGAEALSSGFQDVVLLGETPVGERLFLSDYSGSVLLVSYWSAQCDSCWGQIVELQQIYDDYQQQGLVVALINRGDEMQVINEFLSAKDQVLTLDMLLDRQGRAAAALNILDVPAAILYDRNGQEAARYMHGVDVNLVQKNLGELLQPR